MSAFLLGRDALSNLAYEYVRLCGQKILRFRKRRLFDWGERIETEDDLREWAFQVLLAGNVQSLKLRYGNRLQWQYDDAKAWTFMPPAPGYADLPLNAVHLVTLCGCYRYQAMEGFYDDFVGYARTPAAKLIEELEQVALHKLRGPVNLDYYGPPLKGYVS